MAELMKGHKWRDHKHKMTYPAWVEIKTDEIRCRVVVTPQGEEWPVTFLSYAEKPLANMERFAAGFRALAHDCCIFEFDCGFLANNNFNDSYRWVRSTKGLPPELEGVPTLFILFDLPEHTGTFSERAAERQHVATMAVANGFAMLQPYGEWAHSAEDVESMFEKAREQGHEGLMVKDTTHLYQRGKRTYGWLKVKPEEDADGTIIELIRAVSIEGEPLDRIGSVRIHVEDGSQACPHGIPHELGADMFLNPDNYLCQWAEFRYMERDRQGGYRHPTFVRLREAKA